MTTRRITLLIAVWSIGFASGCEKEPVEQAPVVRPVKIVTIGETGEATTRELPGTIKATQNADMGFEVPGKITEFLVKEGQRVEKTDVLARLDDRDYQADLDQAKASSRKAQADLQRSLRIYEEDPGAISTSKIDTDRKAVDVAEAQVRKAAKAVEDTVLRAPFAGLMARKLVEDFQNVQAKEPVLVLQDISQLEIEVSVPERDMTRGATKRTVEEITQRAQPQVQISSLPGRSFPARVKEFATNADPVTRTFQVRLTFEPPEDVAILPGMTARVTVKVVRDDKIRLPSHATFADADGKPNVWLVDPESMKVQRRPVALGELTGGEVQIIEGVAAGDQVAISGVSQLREGAQVRRYE
ncbi:MAG: efflux RND transporter periplasmic adaptor subunit [Gammaproteobacteria bacterium]|nr:efflux RND transporter periplasmic adaptor subunit [Gammaproteobacteria bacterium]